MIVHIFKVTGPIDVDSFPPSVASSGWVDQLSVGAKSNGSFEISSNTETLYELKTVIVWNSEEEMTNFINTYKLTDATLISDLNSWKAAHGISYTTEYFTSENLTVIPGVV
jgi:hypothetical protein